MDEARDDVYSFLVARRAVARAALHLGLNDMSLEALDSMGEILIGFLERFGQTLAHSVEASGRSSAHVNALDAIRAAELCTSPAVTRVHVSTAMVTNTAGGTATGSGSAAVTGMEDAVAGAVAAVAAAAAAADGDDDAARKQQEDQQKQQQLQDMSWKGLAAFCFGPDWWCRPDPVLTALDPSKKGGVPDGEGDGAAAVAASIPGGGKVGPSAAVVDSTGAVVVDPASSAAAAAAGNSAALTQLIGGGWNAPYPDELPPFPASALSSSTGTSRRKGRHHPRPTPPKSLYEQELNKELQQQQQQSTSAADKSSKSDSKKDSTTITKKEDDRSEGEEEEYLQGMPDAVFYQYEWGTFGAQPLAATAAAAAASLKRKTPHATSTSDSPNAEDEPPKKKVRIDEADKKGAESDKAAADKDKTAEQQADEQKKKSANISRPTNTADYVPKFFPSFPKASDTMGRTVVDLDDVDDTLDNTASADQQAKAAAAESEALRELERQRQLSGGDPALQVRSALINMGLQQDSYWGSGWDSTPAVASSTSSPSRRRLAVPKGRPSADESGVQPQIVPLPRASGSRVSRILEGSMDAANIP